MTTKESTEFERELLALGESRLPISASRISSLTRLAMKASKSFKAVVFSIERFLSKASPEYRLPGFYVVDAITRAASKAPGDSEQAAYLQRFSEKLPGLFGSVQQSGTPPKDFDKLRKLLGHWKKSKLFDEGLLSEIEASVFPPAVSVGDKYVPSDVQLGSSAPGTPPQGMTPRATDAASLLSALAQQQKPLAATTAMTLPPVTIPAPTQQPLATTQAAPPADPEQSRLILNHLLGMMGMAPQALGGPGVAQDSIGPGLLSTSTPTVADNPLEFDYDDEDDGLNSKRPTPVMLQVQPSATPMLGSWPMLPSPAPAPLMNNFLSPQPPSQQQALPGQQQPQVDAMNLLQSIFSQQPQQTINGIQAPSLQHPPPQQEQEHQQQQSAQNPALSTCREAEYDPSIPPDSIRILTRTVYLGNVQPDMDDAFLVKLVEDVARVKVDHIYVNHAKMSAFVRLPSRHDAEVVKETFKTFAFADGFQLKTGWALGYGPKDSFDNFSGMNTVPVSRLTEQETRGITSAVKGGMRPIKPGFVCEEPEIPSRTTLQSRGGQQQDQPQQQHHRSGPSPENGGFYGRGDRHRYEDEGKSRERDGDYYRNGGKRGGYEDSYSDDKRQRRR